MPEVDFYSYYKPLRNHLRKLPLLDSLAVIRAYVQHLQMGAPIPTDCQVASQFLHAENKLDKALMLPEWELETLCREIILNAQENGACPKSLKSWTYLAQAINKLKTLEEAISSRTISQENVLLEMHRLAHRQFPWQTAGLTGVNMTRYFKLYSHPPLDQIIKEIIGLSANEIYRIGLALLGLYFRTFALFYPPNIDIPGFPLESLNKFMKHFALDFASLKRRLQEEHRVDSTYAYAYHSLRAYPLIRVIFAGRDSLICPLPTLLFWRFTNGVYYEICNHGSFDNTFGEAFQTYVGEVLARATKSPKTRIYSDEEYLVGKNRKRTIDWIADQDEAALFIEVKTKRLIQLAKMEISSETALQGELGKMAEIVIQTYKSIQDHLADRYSTYKYKKIRKIYPIIITLEDWFLFGHKLFKELEEKVRAKFQEEQLPLEWLTTMPFTICSIHEFEESIQIMEMVGIETFMNRKMSDPDARLWSLHPFALKAYPEEQKTTQFLFRDVFAGIGEQLESHERAQ